MKLMRKVVIVSVFTFLVVLEARRWNTAKSYAAERATRTSMIEPLPPLPTTRCTDTNEALAICEFEALTHAKDLWPAATHAQLPWDRIHRDYVPVWTHWKDKCYLKIAICPEGRHALTNVSDLLPSDFLALSPPTQIKHLHRANGILHKTTNKLASVLFSPEMYKEITRLRSQDELNKELIGVQNLTGPYREISPTHLEEYSTAIKLIWEVVVDRTEDPKHRFGAHVYNPIPHQTSPPHQLLDPSLWRTDYRIDGSDAPCPPILSEQPGPAPNAPSIPVNCFYHFPVDTSDPRIVAELKSQVPNVITAVPPGKHNAFIILVGIHVMLFNKDTHPLWQWMTFYWTPGTNSATTGWANPWQHYQIETTAAPAEGKPIMPLSEIANPYLEGHIDTDGMKTNCLSCHSLAAYSGAGAKLNDAISIMDRTQHYPQSEQHAKRTHYFDNAVRTHFIWSIATNPKLTYSYLRGQATKIDTQR